MVSELEETSSSSGDGSRRWGRTDVRRSRWRQQRDEAAKIYPYPDSLNIGEPSAYEWLANTGAAAHMTNNEGSSEKNYSSQGQED